MNQSPDNVALTHPQAEPSGESDASRIGSSIGSWVSQHNTELWIALGTMSYLVWILLWQYSRFVSGFFGFHDLTLIADFFTNAIHHGRPFWITDYAINHFVIHFTPTLIFLVPGLLFFDSQFALIALVSGTIAIAMFVFARDHFDALERAGVPNAYRIVLTASLFVLAGLNRYMLRCVDSAHFEPLYILPAVLVLAAVRRGASIGKLLVPCLLALGVRQDAGLFLFFLLGSCLLAPRSWTNIRRGRVCIAALCCVLYILIATKLLLPWFGSSVSTRMWQKWGETWPEVFAAWYHDRSAVYAAIGDSGFLPFNAHFSFLQIVPGLAWLLNQLPGVLFYTADASDKQQLAGYNTSFMLPGMLLCLTFAQLHAIEFTRRIAKHTRHWHHLGLSAISAAFLYAAVSAGFLSDRDDPGVLAFEELDRTDVFTQPQLQQLLACPEVKSIASDFKTIVYVPLAFDKYLLNHARKADVVVQLQQDKRKHLPYYVRPAEVRAELTKQAGYSKAFSVDGYDVFVAPHLKCP